MILYLKTLKITLKTSRSDKHKIYNQYTKISRFSIYQQRTEKDVRKTISFTTAFKKKNLGLT
jgi:hypothetical protein